MRNYTVHQNKHKTKYFQQKNSQNSKRSTRLSLPKNISHSRALSMYYSSSCTLRDFYFSLFQLLHRDDPIPSNPSKQLCFCVTLHGHFHYIRWQLWLHQMISQSIMWHYKTRPLSTTQFSIVPHAKATSLNRDVSPNFSKPEPYPS